MPIIAQSGKLKCRLTIKIIMQYYRLSKEGSTTGFIVFNRQDVVADLLYSSLNKTGNNENNNVQNKLNLSNNFV
jgi:hypothetical protein